MFLRPKESLHLSIYSIKRCMGISNKREFHLTRCTYLRKISSSRRKSSNVQDNESSSSVAGESSVSIEPNRVNDNFFGIESNEGVIEINSKPSLNNNASRHLLKNVEQEKFITTTFGTVRYDSENKPKYHGQLEKEKVFVSSNLEKDKIHDLSQTLLSKSSVENYNKSAEMEKSPKTITNMLDRNLESKLPTSSYVDQLYFPEQYIVKESANISRSESSSTSTNENTVNFIEDSYFNGKTNMESVLKSADIVSENISSDKSHPIHEKSTECTAYDKLSNFQDLPEVESVPSSPIKDKSNLIEESYFSNKMFNESISKSVNVTSKNINDTENIPKKSEVSDPKVVDVMEKRFNQENLIIPPSIEKNKVFKKNFSINEPTVGIADLQVTSRNSTFNSKNLFSAQGTEINTETNLNEINEITADDNHEQLSLQLNNPSLEELDDYNKFLPDASSLPKKKNKFLFQNKEYLKEKEPINAKSTKLEKSITLERNLDESDRAEKNQNKEEVVRNPERTQDIKVKNEANVQNTNEQPETAYDFVKKLRSTKKKLDPELINGKFIQKHEQYDSKGFRILKNQVPNLKYYTKDEILDLLVKNVLYSDDDLIVLNKPYNLVMHESKTTQDPCLSQYLDDLATELDKKNNKPKLITVHRLDKETSGCLLLARNEISAQRLLSLFSQRKIVKTYWIVTIKVPDPLEGVIDMPISEGSVNGRARMVLHPNLPKDIPYQNHSKSGKRAVTHYQVIAESGNAALVEAKPETGIKHQIRVHFGFGLSCPILGDHKYSHLDKLAPQKLQADLLQRLHVRQSKVRHIPMHIYARSMLIPQYRDGRNLFVMAPMPIHMSKNLQKLKFKKK